MMPPNRGDVVLVLFPDSNLVTAKRRPALVIQRDDLQSGLSQTIVAMVTTQYAVLGTQYSVLSTEYGCLFTTARVAAR